MTRARTPNHNAACAPYVGIGLRPPHYRAMLETAPALAMLEVHSENYFGAGGQPLDYLTGLRDRYPLSLHGVGLSLGSADPLSARHLEQLEHLIDRFEPALVSDHLCWSSIGGRHANDLLPLPYTAAALEHLVARVDQVQERLARRILIENISSYVEFESSTVPEAEFLATLAKRTGCGILLDVNNVYVSAVNHGFDARAYLDAIPAAAVEEIHLAGFERAGPLLIDTHGSAVHDPVWDLYAYALERIGPRTTIVEWDSALPPLATLLAEAAKADAHIQALSTDHALAA